MIKWQLEVFSVENVHQAKWEKAKKYYYSPHMHCNTAQYCRGVHNYCSRLQSVKRRLQLSSQFIFVLFVKIQFAEFCSQIIWTPCTGFSSEIGTKLRDWAVGQAWGSCYSWAALSSNDSKTLYLYCTPVVVGTARVHVMCPDSLWPQTWV